MRAAIRASRLKPRHKILIPRYQFRTQTLYRNINIQVQVPGKIQHSHPTSTQNTIQYTGPQHLVTLHFRYNTQLRVRKGAV